MADPWSAVTAHPSGGFAFATSLPGAVEVRLDGRVLWTTAVPTDFLRYIDCAANTAGEVAVIGQGGDGNAWLVQGSGATSLGPSHGQDPVALRPFRNTFMAYVVIGPDRYRAGREELPMPWSSQGIRQVLPDGTVHFGDAYLTAALVRGRTFYRRTEREGWVIGQVEHGIGVATPTHFFTAARRKMAEGIRFALQPGKVAIAALTDEGAFHAVFTAPYPVDAPPPPPPPPKPPPPVQPEKPKVAFPLPSRIHAITVALGNRFEALRRGTDDDRRAFTLKVAEQACFEFGPTWGTKRAGAGRPASKDAIAQSVGGVIVGWDLIHGETREVHGDPIMGEDISDQVFIPVSPVNHLAVPPPATKPPSPPPPPKGEEGELLPLLRDALARLERIERDVAVLRKKVERSYRGSSRLLGTITLTPQE